MIFGLCLKNWYKFQSESDRSFHFAKTAKDACVLVDSNVRLEITNRKSKYFISEPFWAEALIIPQPSEATCLIVDLHISETHYVMKSVHVWREKACWFIIMF